MLAQASTSSWRKQTKTEQGHSSDSLLDMELEDSDDLGTSQVKLEKTVFDCELALKRLLSSHPTPAKSAPADGKCVRLPKLDAPTFDGRLVTGACSGTSSMLPYIVDPLCLRQRNWLTFGTLSRMVPPRESSRVCQNLGTSTMKPSKA